MPRLMWRRATLTTRRRLAAASARAASWSPCGDALRQGELLLGAEEGDVADGAQVVAEGLGRWGGRWLVWGCINNPPYPSRQRRVWRAQCEACAIIDRQMGYPP